MVFLYLSTVIPSIWFLELNLLQFKLPINSSSADLLLLSHIPIAAVGVINFLIVKCQFSLPCLMYSMGQWSPSDYPASCVLLLAWIWNAKWSLYKNLPDLLFPSSKKQLQVQLMLDGLRYLMLSVSCRAMTLESQTMIKHIRHMCIWFVLYCQHCNLIKAKGMISLHFHDHLLLFFSNLSD